MSGHPWIWERRTRHGRAPILEALDRRELMASGSVSTSLGAYVVPSTSGPKVTQPSTVVNPHASIENLLTTILGPGLSQVEAASPSLGNSPQAVLKQDGPQPVIRPFDPLELVSLLAIRLDGAEFAARLGADFGADFDRRAVDHDGRDQLVGHGDQRDDLRPPTPWSHSASPTRRRSQSLEAVRRLRDPGQPARWGRGVRRLGADLGP